MSKKLTLEELNEIAKRISIAYEGVSAVISKEEVENFAKYVEEQDTMMPLLNPTNYMNGGHENLQKVHKRIEALLAFFKEE